jgi:arylsulfatase A-like enzyme
MPPFSGPTQRGYDYFFGFLGGATDYFRVGGGAQGIGGEASGAGAAPAGPSPTALYENDQQVVEPGYLTDLLAERASREIAQCAAARTPFFVSLHFNAPHWPWEGPNDEATSKNIATLRHNDGGSIRKYGEMVVALDSAIGRVLNRLKTAGVERDTLVIFTSDNGGERFSNTWPFIGAKGELLEGGLRVPLIARWPAHIQGGRRSDQLMMSMDFLPTLLAAAGGTADPAYLPDGENLLPVLLGQQSPHMRKVFWRYKANEQAVAREGDWKYLKMANQEFLFNVAEDQRERANLKGKMPELFERLKREYAVWNAAMLPYPANSFSESPRGQWADRY